MNIKEFRNNFCQLAEGDKIITVSKRNEIVGTYTPKNSSKLTCERHLFNNVPCEKDARKKVKVLSGGPVVVANLCETCFSMLKNSKDESLLVVELKFEGKK